MAPEKPLENITVIDCATIVAGPFASTLMGEFGAEVVKIEHPEYGDPVRAHGSHGEELTWKSYGRNKKSVGVDLHEEAGQRIVHELVEDADVFIENFRPGRAEEWNIGWEALSEINPGLVMVRTTGFGQTGPYKDRPGFGTLAESMSGFAYKTGQPDGPPTLPPFALADGISGLYSTFATMFALYWRDVEDGTGQYIDSSLLEPIFKTLMGPDVTEYAETGIVHERQGNISSSIAPRNTYKTKDDRWVAISTSSENIAQRVLRIVGGEELATDPRFDDMESRVENRAEIDAIVADWIAERTRETVLDAFLENDAAIAPVYNVEDIFEDPHVRRRDAIVEIDDEELGATAVTGVFPKLSETPGEIEHLGPELGEHTREVLRERTSLSDGEITELDEKGVIRT